MVRVCIEKVTQKIILGSFGGYVHPDPTVDKDPDSEEYKVGALAFTLSNALSMGYLEEDVEVFLESKADFEIRKAAQIESEKTYADLRRAEYPPFIDLIDGMVKQQSPDSIIKAEGDAQVATYYTDCLLVKENIPKD